MIFEHTETGLRILVRRIDHTHTVTLPDGSKETILIAVDFQTETGQSVMIDGNIDVCSFCPAKVMTMKGAIEGFVEKGAWK